VLEMLELSETKEWLNWFEAMEWASKLGDGWYIPSQKELMIIYASPRQKEFSESGWLWSSTSEVFNDKAAWYIYFGFGDARSTGKTGKMHARCIRGSFEDLLAWCFGKEEKC
jgi:hypothetical protein